MVQSAGVAFGRAPKARVWELPPQERYEEIHSYWCGNNGIPADIAQARPLRTLMRGGKPHTNLGNHKGPKLRSLDSEQQVRTLSTAHTRDNEKPTAQPSKRVFTKPPCPLPVSRRRARILHAKPRTSGFDLNGSVRLRTCCPRGPNVPRSARIHEGKTSHQAKQGAAERSLSILIL